MKVTKLLRASLLAFAACTAAGLYSAVQAADSPPRDGSVLPIPAAAFKGKVGITYQSSTPDFPAAVKAPAGAPNVLLILLDDVGFGAVSAFGGLVDTPELDKLAERGLRYNRFHVTALCSPTRAALLTGRNHHAVGNGIITELANGYDGYHSLWGPESASIAEVLGFNGYSTAAFGKWHNTPDWETSPVGPFTRWPTGKGFDYFFGFQGGEVSQYEPQLFENTSAVEPSKTPEQGYHLTEDLADRAIGWLRTQSSLAPEKPRFVYFAPGATHAPHHAPKEWIEKFKGKFDKGWDAYREETFARQKKLGVIPANAKLTPRPAELPAWDSFDADAKRLFARQMEVYAGFLAHTDHEVGRLIQAAREVPGGENTMVIYITGDNGGSAEGGMVGTSNNMATQNGIPDSVKAQLLVLDELGGPKHENHFAVPWAWAINTPFQWTKQAASHLGGIRNGTVIAWPGRIMDEGAVRTQYSHVVDIAPTIYEAAGIRMPMVVQGAKQTPLAGMSLLYSLSDGNAESRRTTQYYEIFSNRSIYKDGWMASARHGVPWEIVKRGKTDIMADRWELYHLDQDYSQAVDFADSYPGKLEELQAAFDAEAKANHVYPLDDRAMERLLDPMRPSLVRDRSRFSYYPGTVRIPEGSAPNLKMRSHRISTEIAIPVTGAEGVIVAQGGSAGGFTLYVKDGYLTYENNFFGKKSDVLRAASKLSSGTVRVAFEYTQNSKDWAGGGTGKLFIDGRQVAEGDFTHVVPGRFSATETFDVGADMGSAVSTAYHAPFRFTGQMGKLDVEILD
ncbi:arylsulfatase [Burkholderia stabilis]|uniref:Arylsulfatase n=1 Tax=Burkholderia stabilis TaxID=95485 RepID=A0A4Q2A647_9BURK|nr:arylsulfatase [Burkholderia stabilis]RXV64578.1 arylsulfatase [Burkholderia stabilis]